MNRFKVWLRPEGRYCHVRVEGGRNGRWLRKHLLKLGITPSVPHSLDGTDSCTFQIPLGKQMRFDRLKELISAIAEVQLMFGVRI